MEMAPSSSAARNAAFLSGVLLLVQPMLTTGINAAATDIPRQRSDDVYSPLHLHLHPAKGAAAAAGPAAASIAASAINAGKYAIRHVLPAKEINCHWTRSAFMLGLVELCVCRNPTPTPFLFSTRNNSLTPAISLASGGRLRRDTCISFSYILSV